MKSLIQVVEEAEVKVDSEVTGSIGRGMLIFLGVKDGDGKAQVEEMAAKVLGLRIFPDEKDKMNLSVRDVGGEILVISQFTLYGRINSGRRPSFSEAGSYEESKELYRDFISELKMSHEEPVKSGSFGSHMRVNLTNDGPITFLVES